MSSMTPAQYYDAVRANITSTGLHIQAVFGDRNVPGFAYTIGLHEKLGYELIVFAISPESAAHVMNHIARTDKPIELDAENTDFFNLPVKFKRCEWEQVRDYAVQAFRFYENEDIPFVQIVLCDKLGLFPEAMDFDHAYMDVRQPLLYKVMQ